MVSIRLRLTYCKQNWTTGSREGSILSNKPIFVIFEKKLYFSVGTIVIVGGDHSEEIMLSLVGTIN